MPFYEYRCDACGHELEAMQKMSDPPLSDCPACEKPELVKLVSAAGFRLKGGGWYETDFKSGGKKNVADSAARESSDKPSSDKPSSGKPSSGGHSCSSGGCSACN